MKNVLYISFYILLVGLWSILFYNYFAPEKDGVTMLKMLGAAVFFSGIWAVLASLSHKWIGWKGYGMLLLPPVILVVFILGIDQTSFKYALGLTVISELVSLVKIFFYRRKALRN
jgi:O-antigen/teichoic acid export membrane protein